MRGDAGTSACRALRKLVGELSETAVKRARTPDRNSTCASFSRSLGRVVKRIALMKSTHDRRRLLESRLGCLVCDTATLRRLEARWIAPQGSRRGCRCLPTRWIKSSLPRMNRSILLSLALFVSSSCLRRRSRLAADPGQVVSPLPTLVPKADGKANDMQAINSAA